MTPKTPLELAKKALERLEPVEMTVDERLQYVRACCEVAQLEAIMDAQGGFGPAPEV